jgi:hypothetical protein
MLALNLRITLSLRGTVRLNGKSRNLTVCLNDSLGVTDFDSVFQSIFCGSKLALNTATELRDIVIVHRLKTLLETTRLTLNLLSVAKRFLTLTLRLPHFLG